MIHLSFVSSPTIAVVRAQADQLSSPMIVASILLPLCEGKLYGPGNYIQMKIQMPATPRAESPQFAC